MAETIGRVDFIVSLDGKKLPAEAKVLGEKTGRELNKGMSKELRSSFEKSITPIGESYARKMSKTGKLAGTNFGSSFNSAVTANFRRMQTDVANILSDKTKFRQFADGFDTVDQAVSALHRNLETLNTQQVQYTDSLGRTRKQWVLNNTEMMRFKSAASGLGNDLEKLLVKERIAADVQDELAAKFARLTRSIGDKEVFTAYADSVGGTENAFKRLRNEVESTGGQLGKGRVEIEKWVDKLDATRVSVDKVRNGLVDLEKHPGIVARAFETAGNKISTSWARMDSTVRLVLTLILSAGDQVAALGSAVGAGIFGLGAVLAEGVLGVGALVVAFTALNQKLAKAPEAMRPLIEEFQGFKGELKELRTQMTLASFSQMNGDFKSLQKTVDALTPALTQLGASAGIVFDNFATGIAPGTAAFYELNTLIQQSAKDFPVLASATGTWATAILRALNRANPLVEQFLGWLDRIGSRFDSFTRSSNFAQWVNDAQRTFRSLGGLIDQLGRSLNDLSNAASVDQLNALIQDLTRLTPALAGILQVFGQLNPLGLLVQLLADLGTAIMPILPPLTQLATIVGQDLSVAVSTAAAVISPAMPVIGGLIQLLADLVSLIPPPAIQALAVALLAVGGAVASLNAAKGLATFANTILEMSPKLLGAAVATDTLAGSLEKVSGVLGKLGTLGLVAAGAVAVGAALGGWIKQMTGVDDAAKSAVQSNKGLVASYNAMNDALVKNGQASKGAIDSNKNLMLSNANLHDSVAQLAKSGGGFWGTFADGWTSKSTEIANSTSELRNTLGTLDAPLASLAKSNLPAATAQFSAWAREAGASKEQINAMLDAMPKFKEAIGGAAEAQGQVATQTNIATIAMGGMTDKMLEQNGVLDTLSGKLTQGRADVDGLAAAIRGFGDANLTTRDAERQFQAAIDDATAAVAKNGTSLDITTEAGRANQAALDAIATSALSAASATWDQTHSVDAATTAIQAGRDALINQLTAMGMTKQEAEKYADSLGLIPANIDTYLHLNGVDEANSQVKTFYQRWNGSTITFTTKVNGTAANPRGGAAAFAAGTVANRATFGVFGEAGPEAIVPLRRPLSQVDPSVRALSAIAQGMPQYGNGGIVGTGAGVTIQKIEVNEADDANYTANEVVQRIFEKVGG